MEAFIDLFFQAIFGVTAFVVTSGIMSAICILFYRYVDSLQEAIWLSPFSRPVIAIGLLFWIWLATWLLTSSLLGGWPGDLAPLIPILWNAENLYKSLIVVASVKTSVVVLDNFSRRKENGDATSGRMRVVNGGWDWKFPDPWEVIEDEISMKDETVSETIWFPTKFKWPMGVKYTLLYQRDTRTALLDRSVELDTSKINAAIDGMIRNVFQPFVVEMNPEEINKRMVDAANKRLTKAVAGTAKNPVSDIEERFAIKATSVAIQLLRNEKHEKALRIVAAQEKFMSTGEEKTGHVTDKEALHTALLSEEDKGAVRQSGVVVHGENFFEQMASLAAGIMEKFGVDASAFKPKDGGKK